MMALVDRRQQLDGQEKSRARRHTHMKTGTHLCSQTDTHAFFPDSCELPGTLVSDCCKSGLSASEDSDHISKNRKKIEAYQQRIADKKKK